MLPTRIIEVLLGLVLLLGTFEEAESYAGKQGGFLYKCLKNGTCTGSEWFLIITACILSLVAFVILCCGIRSIYYKFCNKNNENTEPTGFERFQLMEVENGSEKLGRNWKHNGYYQGCQQLFLDIIYMLNLQHILV